jgi:hypothetical protein
MKLGLFLGLIIIKKKPNILLDIIVILSVLHMLLLCFHPPSVL